jgi:hypothetical protein
LSTEDAALAGVAVFVGQAQLHRDGGAGGAGRVDVFQEALLVDVEGGVDLGHDTSVVSGLAAPG